MKKNDIINLGLYTKTLTEYERDHDNVDEDVINVIKKDEDTSFDDITIARIEKYRKQKIELLEGIIDSNIRRKNKMSAEINKYLDDINETLAEFKSKGIISLAKDIQYSLPINISETKLINYKNVLTLLDDSKQNKDYYDLLLSQYFNIKQEKESKNFILNFPKSLLNLFVPGDINYAYFNNIDDVVALKKLVNEKYELFLKEKREYLNQFSKDKMNLYIIDNRLDINEIEKCLKYHEDKIDSNLFYDIYDKLQMIHEITDKGKVTKKKKEMVSALCYQLISPVKKSIEQIKSWYKNSLYNDTLGITKELKNTKQLENIIDNPDNIDILYSIIEKQQQKYLDLLYEVEIVKEQIKIKDSRYDEKLNNIVNSMTDASIKKNKELKKVLDEIYLLSNRYQDGEYLIIYSKPKLNNFIEIIHNIISSNINIDNEQNKNIVKIKAVK